MASSEILPSFACSAMQQPKSALRTLGTTHCSVHSHCTTANASQPGKSAVVHGSFSMPSHRVGVSNQGFEIESRKEGKLGNPERESNGRSKRGRKGPSLNINIQWCSMTHSYCRTPRLSFKALQGRSSSIEVQNLHRATPYWHCHQ